MRITYLDPGLSARVGHNASMLIEFEEALVRQRGHTLDVLGSPQLARNSFSDLACTFTGTSQIDGYTRLSAASFQTPNALESCIEALASDYLRAGLPQAGVIMAPTVYPLHLIALAAIAPKLAHPTVAAGFLIPLDFWCDDAKIKAQIATLLERAIAALSDHTRFFAYSETGTYRFDDRICRMATLLPPWGSSTAERLNEVMRSHEHRTFTGKLGFFGSPFTSKGINLLVDVLSAGGPAAAALQGRLVIRLPQGHEPLCAQLRAAFGVDAISAPWSNAQYLLEMSRVDIVWALYDAAYYGDKMSGIVPEAIALGKPVLIGDGCGAIQDFLERYAPGSFIACSYDRESLGAALHLDLAQWQAAAQCALQHAEVMQRLKGMDRYLACCNMR